jgi:hypothetical protein
MEETKHPLNIEFQSHWGKYKKVKAKSWEQKCQADSPALRPDGPRSGAKTDGPTDSARQSAPYARASASTQRKNGETVAKQNITHMVGWSKLALLLINSSPNMLARRSFYAIGQQKNLGRPLKQNGRIKWPERRHNKHHLFIQWWHDIFHPPTHRWYTILFKCEMVR